MANLSSGSTTVIGRDTSSWGYGWLYDSAQNAKAGLGKVKAGSQQYNDLVKAIDTYWTGADADAFKNLLAKLTQTIDKAYKQCDKAMVALQNDKNSFNSLVNKNSSVIK